MQLCRVTVISDAPKSGSIKKKKTKSRHFEGPLLLVGVTVQWFRTTFFFSAVNCNLCHLLLRAVARRAHFSASLCLLLLLPEKAKSNFVSPCCIVCQVMANCSNHRNFRLICKCQLDCVTVSRCQREFLCWPLC